MAVTALIKLSVNKPQKTSSYRNVGATELSRKSRPQICSALWETVISMETAMKYVSDACRMIISLSNYTGFTIDLQSLDEILFQDHFLDGS